MYPTRRPALLLFVSVALAAVLPTLASANSAPVITNVVAQQIPNTGDVEITYDVSDADGDLLAANFVCSSNNGTDYDLYPVSVTGDVRKPMSPGAGKRIVWHASADYPGRYWSQVVVKVVVNDSPSIVGPMLPVGSGTFMMGGTDIADQQPVHQVSLDTFLIDKYEVTNADFEAFINAQGYTTKAFWSEAGWFWRQQYNILLPLYWTSTANNSGPSFPGFPVVGISWYEAEAFSRFVGKRLPTEAEWEMAARGVNSYVFPWGSTLDGSRANYSTSGDPYEGYGSTPVGFFDGRLHPSPAFQTTDSPGPYGAYDQCGNVWEWVQDWYGDYYASSPASNPPGPVQGAAKVMRGGSWVENPGPNPSQTYPRTYFRNAMATATRDRAIGFRCARTP